MPTAVQPRHMVSPSPHGNYILANIPITSLHLSSTTGKNAKPLWSTAGIPHVYNEATEYFWRKSNHTDHTGLLLICSHQSQTGTKDWQSQLQRNWLFIFWHSNFPSFLLKSLIYSSIIFDECKWFLLFPPPNLYLPVLSSFLYCDHKKYFCSYYYLYGGSHPSHLKKLFPIILSIFTIPALSFCCSTLWVGKLALVSSKF